MLTIDLYKSNKPDKKFMIKFINPETNRNKTIHFGAFGMNDYTLTNDIIAKNRYIQRHQIREDWSKNGIYTAGFWSRWLLWNKPNIMESIEDIEKKFKIKINNKIDDLPNKDIEKVINEKHSAYRSMKLSQLGLSKPTNKKNEGDLLRWQMEKWLNLNALVDNDEKIPCGKKYKGQTSPTVCRPSVRINDR